MASTPAESNKTWQQTKSELTRQTILDAALDCFYDMGYANTTTENISKRAGVSRGAMLHHFPTRFDLIKAAVEHLTEKRLELFAAQEQEVNRDAEYTRVEEGIDAYWNQLNTPLFVVFHELQVAARTDADLEKVRRPAVEQYNARVYETAKTLFPDLALSEAFNRANLLTTYLMEGMAFAQTISGDRVPADKMLSWLKRELRRSFQDVLGRVKR